VWGRKTQGSGGVLSDHLFCTPEKEKEKGERRVEMIKMISEVMYAIKTNNIRLHSITYWSRPKSWVPLERKRKRSIFHS
jgi:hypothetical protein